MKSLNKYSVSFNSQLNILKAVLEDISSFIKDYLPDISGENVNELKLIFSELLCNAVVHGNNLNDKKAVNLYIEIDGENISSTIKDEGNGFDYTTFFNDSDFKSNLLEENGRGMLLVHALSDSLSFNSCGNEIHFCKKVNTNV